MIPPMGTFKCTYYLSKEFQFSESKKMVQEKKVKYVYVF